MTMLEQIKIFYLNNDNDEFLRYEILADRSGRAVLVLVLMSLQQQIGQLSYAVWTKIDELAVAAEAETPEAALQLAVTASIRHRADWKK